VIPDDAVFIPEQATESLPESMVLALAEPTLTDVYALLLAIHAQGKESAELLARYVDTLEKIGSEVGPIVEKLQASPIMRLFK
jgi:hypothetical protein